MEPWFREPWIKMHLAQLHLILDQAEKQVPDFSDIILTAGSPVRVEAGGELHKLELAGLDCLCPFHLELLANALLGQQRHLVRDLLGSGSCDLAFQLPDKKRFRVNIFRQQGNLAIVMRKLTTTVPSAEKLGLPAAFMRMAQEKDGLVLVTGATGSGKTTSLAALIDTINTTSAQHIITLEDPVEYLHPHKKSIINQRELGSDFDSFANGLRAALRQAPKVILVGEIRDRQTLHIALEAAETGHLVLGTLHTSDCGQTIHRIVGMFDFAEEKQIRARLADSLKCILSQRLMPQKNGSKVAAFELLVQTLQVQEVILYGETEEKCFYDIQEQGEVYGMCTFDQSLSRLFRQGQITEKVAMFNGSSKSTLRQALDRIKNEQGQTATSNKLEIDADYGQTPSS